MTYHWIVIRATFLIIQHDIHDRINREFVLEDTKILKLKLFSCYCMQICFSPGKAYHDEVEYNMPFS